MHGIHAGKGKKIWVKEDSNYFPYYHKVESGLWEPDTFQIFDTFLHLIQLVKYFIFKLLNPSLKFFHLFLRVHICLSGKKYFFICFHVNSN